MYRHETHDDGVLVAPHPSTIDTKEALARIEAVRAQVWATGAVDTEPATLNMLHDEVLAGTLSPEEAVQRAEQILASRQDYH